MVRITGSLNKDVKPQESLVLELLQCPFAGIKKTSFILLKQMYQLNIVDRVPPPVFSTYLKLDPELTKGKLDPITANIISGYLYSWQAIIERRSTIERPASQEE